MATTMPTWLTGLLVAARIAKSAADLPRNSQRSPVEAIATASSSVRVAVGWLTPRYPTRAMRARWKIVGLAGIASVAATGVVIARKRRATQDYDPNELRGRLHRRLDEASTRGDGSPGQEE